MARAEHKLYSARGKPRMNVNLMVNPHCSERIPNPSYFVRPLWTGVISFGLVNIPVGLYSAMRYKSTVDLHLLRDSDLSPISYKKVAEAAPGSKKTSKPAPGSSTL
jgi:hypothetical protein